LERLLEGRRPVEVRLADEQGRDSRGRHAARDRRLPVGERTAPRARTGAALRAAGGVVRALRRVVSPAARLHLRQLFRGPEDLARGFARDGAALVFLGVADAVHVARLLALE